MEKLLNELKPKINELIDQIKESKEYQRFIELSKTLKENNTIMNTINKIKDNQKKLVNLEYYKKDTKNIEDEINRDIAKLNSYPVYTEYNYLLEDLNNEFQNIKYVIENTINNNLN